MRKRKVNTKYGLKLDVPSPEHWVFGSSEMPYEVLQADGDWSNYLVVKERQDLNNVEPYACVVYTLLNCIEILIKRKYGLERNYSDRFLATIVNTRGKGSSPQEACEFLRKIGVVLQEIYPFDETIDTEDKFFAPIPQSIIELAKEFNEEWDFKHEFVKTDNESITTALKSSPLMISVYAWVKNSKDLFYRPNGVTDNHATTLIYERVGEFRRIFDSYDSPFIKDLEYGDIPTIIKRFRIEKKTKLEAIKKDNIIIKLWNWFMKEKLIFRNFKIFWIENK
jgi:hypothetical protein